MAQHDGLFGILLDIDNHRIVVADGIVFALGSILGHRNGREEPFDLLLHLIDIHIAHHNDGLQVRTVPLLVIVPQVLILEVVDHLHRTYRHTVLIFRAAVHLWHRQFHQSLYGTSGTTCAPLLVNHATLLVNLLILQQQVVTPIVQDEQTRVNDTLAFQGYSRNIIHRLLDTGIGIQVGTKLHTDGLAPGNDTQTLALAREILRPVKCHMLQKMSQSALTGLFLNRAHTLGNIEFSQSGFLGIMTDVVRHTIL